MANATYITIFGASINVMAIAMLCIVVGLMVLFYRIQSSKKLDFADMITKNGTSVSLTKVLQLVGGLTATWVIVKLTLGNNLTEAVFGLYLTYVGAVEGYSKYLSAKHGYNENSVKSVAKKEE
jgi:amino acid transporter